MIALSYLLPSWLQLAGLLGVFVSGAVFWLVGRALAGGRGTPELQLFAGWGAYCLVLTLWGVATQASMVWPTLPFLLLAAGILAVPALRPTGEDAHGVLRILVLALPIWAIMAAAQPALPDTFTNFLPNAVYLFDHGFFPADDRAGTFATWPAFPYNQPLATYLATLVLPQYPPGALIHFNLLLQIMAGLLFARALRPRDADFAAAPSWGACAGGLLLVMALNPGFVPRIDFTAYAEPALSVGVCIVGFLAARILAALVARDDAALRQDRVLLAVSLVALVGIKQVGIVLAFGLMLGMVMLALADRRIARMRALALIVTATLPALVLYAAWRWYVLGHFAFGRELELLPPSSWQFGILPQTLRHIIGAIAEIPVYFSMIAIIIVAAIALTWRQGLRDGTRLLLLTAVLFAVYNAFLIVIYVIHMGPGAGADAHSYFRYMTHLSLIAMLSLTVTARDWLLARKPAGRAASWTRWLPAGAVILALLVPLPFLKRLRFDTQMPQPLIWGLARDVAGEVKDGDRLAVLLPGDNGSTSLMLRAALALTPPRRDLDIYDVSAVPGGIGAGLEAAAQRGYRNAVLSCAAAENAAQLLAYDGTSWRVVKSWPYQPVAARERWTTVLAAAPLCHS